MHWAMYNISPKLESSLAMHWAMYNISPKLESSVKETNVRTQHVRTFVFLIIIELFMAPCGWPI
jgi:phosphatidylethanolamine-binding protein (PEBP) family uncharacterized protein